MYFQRKAQDDGNKRGRKRRLTLAPRVVSESILSDASTIPYNISGDVENVQVNDSQWTDVSVGEVTVYEMEAPGIIVSDTDSLTSLSDDEQDRREEDPIRDDMPIVTTRWRTEEVSALFDAVNINRDAIKFFFDGPGGGKDVKRQGWRDVASKCSSCALVKYM